MTIYKYGFDMDDEISIRMPVGATVLCVQMQYDTPTIWALVDEAAETEMRRFYLRGTGHPARGVEDMRYIGTFQMNGGRLVFHLFEPRR